MTPTAAGLAAYGRYGDSTLVHMTPGEVAGLQALAKANGTSLTINPHTGLPEAFSLKAFLPALAGMALAPLTAGTSLAFLGASPLAAGLTIGGLHGLATGFKNPMASLTAGLGGAGGAGLGSAMGLGGAAAAAPAQAAGTAFSPAAADIAANLGVQGAASGAGSQAVLLAEQAAGFGAPGLSAIQSGASYAPGSSMFGSGAAQAAASQAAAPVVEVGRSAGLMDKMRIGITDPSQMGLSRAAMLAAAPVASSAMEMEEPSAIKPVSTIRPYEFKREVTPGAFDDLTDSRERRYFNDQFIAGTPHQLAKGGLATYARGGKAKKFDPLEQRYEMADFRDPQAMQKKTMGMYQYAAGGQTIRGPGDGMSDDVKANIDGVQEARLSDGEFVIPADVVSGLGNGSTEAGSKQLKEMMNRVRKKRTGRTRQAPQIKVKGLMPA